MNQNNDNYWSCNYLKILCIVLCELSFNLVHITADRNSIFLDPCLILFMLQNMGEKGHLFQTLRAKSSNIWLLS